MSSNELLDNEEEIDPIKEIKLNHSAIDCTFIGDHLVSIFDDFKYDTLFLKMKLSHLIKYRWF